MYSLIDELKENRIVYSYLILQNLSDEFIKYIFENFKLEYDEEKIFESYINKDKFLLSGYQEYDCLGEFGSLVSFIPYIVNKLVSSNPKRVGKSLYNYIYGDKKGRETLSELKDKCTEIMDLKGNTEKEKQEDFLFSLANIVCFFKDTDDWCHNMRYALYSGIIEEERATNETDDLLDDLVIEFWNTLPDSKEYYFDNFYYDDEVKKLDDILGEIAPNIKKEVWNAKINYIINKCIIEFICLKYGENRIKEKISNTKSFDEKDANTIIRFIQSRITQMLDAYSIIKEQISNKCLQLSSNEEGVTVIDNNTEELQALQDENNLLSINNKKLQDEKDNLQAQLNVFLKDEKREENEEIRELKKQVALLENQASKKDVKIDELEEFVEVLQNDSSEEILELFEDYDFEFMQSKRFLFIGGRNETNRELEKIFPNAKFVNNENVNIFINDKLSGCSFLPDSMKMLNTRTQFDFIVFFPKFMNHALFYKYKKEGLNRNIPYMLINFNNIDLILKNMYLEIITGADAEIA